MTIFDGLTDLRTQFVIFFKKNKTLNFEGIAVQIKNSLKLEFVSPSKYTNLPEGIPIEIPRLEMQTHDNAFQIAVSMGTISLSYNKTITNRDETYSQLLLKIKSLAEIISEYGTINRVGYITNQFLLCHNPSDFILGQVTHKKIESAFEASYRVVLKSKYDNKDFNESYQFEQGERVDQGKAPMPIVIVTRDNNTPPSNNTEMTPEMVCDFIQKTYKTLDKSRIETVFGV